MLTCFVVGFLTSIVALLASLVIAWAVKHTPVDRYEYREQSDADVRVINDSMRGTL